MPLLAVALSVALMQTPAVPKGAAVSGQVLEAGTQVPIAGAQVVLLPVLQGPPPTGPFSLRPTSTTTDESGRFVFIDTEPGRYRFNAQKSGFAIVVGLGPPPMIELKSGERIDNLQLILQRGGVIAGRVVDQAGEPLADARVMVLRKPSMPPQSSRAGAAAAAARLANRLLPAGSSGQTNDLGEFRVHSLPPGDYYVQAAPRVYSGRPGVPGAAAAAATTMVPTYFPSTTDSSAAQPIQVGAGQTTTDVEVRMVIASVFRVSGTVVDEAGQAVTNAMVRLTPQNASGPPQPMMRPFNQGRTDASGGFSIDGVTNGAYTLIAVPPLVTASPPQRTGGATGGSSSFWFGGSAGGVIGGGVTTESSNGVTVQYRDDAGTQLPVTVSEGSVTGLQLVVRLPSAR
jgi:protocatechuate 3,4-dioxygenase beta subunit